MKNIRKSHLSRRSLIRGLAMGSAAALAACAPQAAAPAAAPAAPAAPTDAKSAAAKPAEATLAPTAAPAADTAMTFEANNKDQWAKIPANHKPGTLVTEAEWKALLGAVPTEPITVAGFKGGWGEAWIDAAIEQMKKDYPGIKIEKDFDPRIWENLNRLRSPPFLGGE